MDVFGFCSMSTAAVGALYVPMKNLAACAAALGRTDHAGDGELGARQLDRLAELAQESITELNNEVDAIEDRVRPFSREVSDPEKDWATDPRLDWNARRAERTMRGLSDECEWSIATVVEALYEYSSAAQAEREGAPISVEAQEEPEWSRTLDELQERLANAGAVSEDASVDESVGRATEAMRAFLLQCGGALEQVQEEMHVPA